MKRVIVGLIILALLGGAGYGGWHYWQTKHPAKKTNNNQQANQNQPKPTEDTYLVIKEWGVRIKLSNNIKEASYYFSDDSNGKTIFFSVPAVKKLAGCENSELYGIQRAKDGESIGSGKVSDLKNYPNHPLIQIDEYYYLSVGPAFGCTDRNDTQATDIYNAVRSELSAAEKTLEKVPNM